MPRNRMINEGFRDDEYILDLDPTEKLLFLYILTNNKNTLSGIYKYNMRKMCFETGIDKDMISKIFQRFEDDRKVIIVENYIFIVSFMKHQTPNPKMKIAIEKEIVNIPDEIRHKLKKKKAFDSLCIAYDSVSVLFYSILFNTMPPDGSGESLLPLPPEEQKTIQTRKTIPPKLEWVEQYCKERNNGIDPEAFIDHYEANGWIQGQGKKKVKDWQACIRTWENRKNPKKDDNFYEQEIHKLWGDDYGAKFRAKYGAELHEKWRKWYKNQIFSSFIESNG